MSDSFYYILASLVKNKLYKVTFIRLYNILNIKQFDNEKCSLIIEFKYWFEKN